MVPVSVDRSFGRAYRRDMANMQDQLAQTLKRLQVIADKCASSFSNYEVKVEYRVAFSHGAPFPWRLVEIHRAIKKAGTPRTLRRMHCFRSCESLDHSVRERITWKARDQALVKAFFVRVEGAPDNDSPGRPSTKALNATRLALRAQMCSTRPDRAVDLPH